MANEAKLPAFVLTAGNIVNISVASTRLDAIAPRRHMLADKAYDAHHLRDPLEAVDIPSTGSRRHPDPLDRLAC